MELTGTITKIFDIETFNSGFQKQSIVLTTDEQYPQPIQIEFTSDKIELVSKVQEGQKAKVSINLRGREWISPQGETKYFNSITGWRIEAEKPDF